MPVSILVAISAAAAAGQDRGTNGKQTPDLVRTQWKAAPGTVLDHYDFGAQLNALQGGDGPPASPPNSQVPAGTAVPKSFQPSQDIQLTPTAKEAVRVSEKWMASNDAPAAGPDRNVLYSYGAGLPTVVCAPLRVCIIELQSGEKIVGEPQIRDSVRWNLAPATYGSRNSSTSLVVLKPQTPGLDAGNSNCRRTVVEGTKLRYYEMTCREHSVDLVAPGVLPDMRRLLEGEAWDKGKLDPSNVSESAKRYPMWVSVTGLVLTRDDYFILQRRSSAVAAGVGSIAASLNGGVDWFDDCDDLQMAACENSRRRLGLCPLTHILAGTAGPVPPRDRPFIGEAYNLRYGRDLNFYCCFATSLLSSEVSELRQTLFFERTRARDAWEVENVVFLKPDRVTVPALESGEIDRLIPNRARHLLGALYAYAKYSG